MAKLIPVPKLGQSEETVSIVKWHKAEGDTVVKGDVLFEVETDKAVLEVESQFEGTLLKIIVPAGKEVPVMSTAAVIGAPGEAIPKIEQPAAPAAAAKAAPAAARPAPAAAAPRAAAGGAPTAPAVPLPTTFAAAPTAVPAKHAVSPRARKFASEYLISLDAVPGTGPDGRVVEKDVKTYLDQSGYLARKITPAAFNLAKSLKFSIFDLPISGLTGRITVADVRRAEAERPKVMSKMRQAIARRLQMSKQVNPHFYVTVSVDMTALVEFRKKLKDAGYTLTINDFIVKAVALTLRELPVVNSSTDDGVHLKWHSDINVGVAVTVDAGLVVPVLRNTDRMSLDELHDVARELADKARAGKLSQTEIQGGTFTVSNMGMMNVENFLAIINPGESAILAVASAMPTPVVNAAREVVVRDMMKITLSVDHRVIDGANAALFVNGVKKKLEDLELWKRELGMA